MARGDSQLGQWAARNAPAIWGALLGGGLISLAYALGLQSIPHTPWVVPIAAVLGAFAGKAIATVTVEGSGRAAQSIHMPAATGTYIHTRSNIDAMEAKGDHAGAAHAWDSVALERPADPWPLIRAGELYLRTLGEPAQALDRFRRARDLPGTKPEQQRYAAQKVIDIYLGPLKDEGRAMVELRKLIDRHPGTREAAGAREALKALKGG